MEYSHFDDLLDAIFIYNKNKEIIYCNEACSTMIGTSLKRLKVGKPVYDFVTFEDEQIFFMKDGNLGKDQEMKYREIPFTTKGDKSGVGLTSIKKFSDQEWIAIVRDMSLEVQLHEKHHKQLAELENYSKNLEKMVEERTEELREAHYQLDMMVNSIGQGLMVFGPDNICLPVKTNACDEIFGLDPVGKPMWEVLGLDKKEEERYKKWSDCVFSEMLPFKDLIDLGITFKTNQLEHTDPNFKYTGIEYFPMRDKDDALIGVVTVATDRTEEIRAQKAMEEKEAYASMVTKVIRNKKQFLSFISDAKNIITDMEKALNHKEEVFDHASLMRLMHSIKGGASLYSIKMVVDQAHQYETELSDYKDKSAKERQKYLSNLEANIKNIEGSLKEFLQECKSFMGESIEDGEHRVEIKIADLEDFNKKIHKLPNPCLEKQFNSAFLTEPIIKYFSGYDDLIEDLANRLRKKVNPIKFSGGDLKIKAEPYSEFFNVLVHLFRNSMDHGIEEEEIRLNFEKQPEGTICVDFKAKKTEEGNRLFIVISDDGAGIDPSKIRNHLIKAGREAETKDKNDQEIINYIFAPSFSTKTEVTEVSGRGVGMDAVKDVICKMGGAIEVHSTPEKGSAFLIDVPLFQE